MQMIPIQFKNSIYLQNSKCFKGFLFILILKKNKENLPANHIFNVSKCTKNNNIINQQQFLFLCKINLKYSMYGYQPLGVSFASPLQTSIVRPQYSYAAPLSYAQPVQYAPPVSYAQPVYSQPAIKGESRVEYHPYERPVVELEDEVRTVKVPKQKWVTDYYPVEYQKEYIPQVSIEKQVEYRPVEKHVPRVDYVEVEREVRRSSYVAPVSYASPLSYSVAAPVAPLAQSYVAPQYAYAPSYAPQYSYAPYAPQVSYAPQFGYQSYYRPYY
ncbi:hypothetical protein pb186bvf_014678 [Paramecium bursaria]